MNIRAVLWAAEQNVGAPGDLAALVVLAKEAAPSTYITPRLSNECLGAMSFCSGNTFGRAAKRLIQAGLIRVVDRSTSGGTSYQLLINDDEEAAA